MIETCIKEMDLFADISNIGKRRYNYSRKIKEYRQMGMAASQCRLLSLTARMSDLEYQAQSISNAKIRLSQNSEAVANEYAEALDKKKLTVLSGYDATTGAMNYVDASAYNLTTYNAISTLDKQRFLKDSSGRVLVTKDMAVNYDAAIESVNSLHNEPLFGGNEETFISYYLGSHLAANGDPDPINSDDPRYNKYRDYEKSVWSGEELFLRKMGYTSCPDGISGFTYCAQGQGVAAYYTNVFNEIKENGYNKPGDDNMKSEEWLYAQLQGGNVSLSEWDHTANNNMGDFVDVSWSSGDSTLKTQTDDADVARAEAKYKLAMAQIESKDKRFDLSLKQIDTEHSAIQTEMDSVKKIVDKNIERSFKTFANG